MKISLVLLFPSLITLSCQLDSDRQGPQLRRLPDAQTFTIVPTKDTVLFGEKGTRIIVLANSLIDSEGKVVVDTVDVELTEAFGMATQMQNGMKTTNQNAVLKLNFYRRGEMLTVVESLPLYIQIPSTTPLDGAQLVAGRAQTDGQIHWLPDRPKAQTLVPVPFSTLAYHPATLAEELKAHLPFGDFDAYSIRLADSLYFSFAGGEMTDLVSGMPNTYLREAYDNPSYQVINGTYTQASFQGEGERHSSQEAVLDVVESGSENCGIDPIQIAALKDKKWQHTFLATPAFAERLQHILAIGDTKLLECYTHNLDRDLYLSDQAAALLLENDQPKEAIVFSRFAKEGLTNTRSGARYASVLRRSINRRMRLLEQEIAIRRAELKQMQVQQNTAATEMISNYQHLLWQREQHRMLTYGYEWTNVGFMWLKPNPVIATDTITDLRIKASIFNPIAYSERYVYLVFPAVQSLYKLNTKDQQTFYTGDSRDELIPVLKNRAALLVGIGYRGNQIYIARKNILLSENQQHELRLEPSSREELDRLLRFSDAYASHSQLQFDLNYSRALMAEQGRQNQQWHEQYILYALGMAAFPHCNAPDMERGKWLIRQHCSSCHDITSTLTGPALLDVVKRNRSKAWFMRFTHNSQAMIAHGDPQAGALWQEWGPAVMNSHPDLSIQDLQDIYHYIQTYR